MYINRLKVALMLGYAIQIHALQLHMTNLGVKHRSHARGLSSRMNSDCWRHQVKNRCPNRGTSYLTMQSALIDINGGNHEEDDVRQDGNYELFSPNCDKPDINASHAMISTASTAPLSYEHKRTKSKIKVTVSILFLFSFCWALIACSGQGAWRYYLAGGICAAISHAITTPVDVIKTRKQVDESMKDMSMIQSGLKIIKDDGGLNALLAGLGPTTFGYLFEGAVKFGIYEVSKPLIGSFLAWSAALCKLPWINSKMLGFVISGGIAGAAASVMLCPMEALRIRLVAEPELAAVGWIDGGLSMIGNEGIKGFWKSLPAMLSKQVPYTITKNVSFDFITTVSYTTVAAYGLTICSKWKLVIPLLSAMLASILSCISSQPGDMLLSVVNAEEGKKSTTEFAREIMKRDGFAGFFVGVRERFLHVGIIVTMQLLIYDFVKRLVGISATGL